MKINTTPGETYIVLSTGGCTATTGAGKQIKRLAAGQDFFTAMTGDTVISDDNANVTVAKGELLSLLNTDSTGSGVQATLQFQPVTNQSALPTPGENGVIYLVPNNAEAPNQYTEWVWTGAAYEQLGDVGVDLDGYVSKEDLDITSIEAGETGPQITSGATLITKAVQVDSLKVGDFVSASPSADPDGLNSVTITSTVVNLAENVDVNLGTGTRINLSESSWLSGEQVRLSGITVVGALRFGSSGTTYHLDGSSGRLGRITLVNGLQLGTTSTYGLDRFGDGTLGDLAVTDGLKLGSGGTYGFDSQGRGKLYTLTVTNMLQYGESGKYGVDQSGNGSLWTLSVMSELQLGEVDSYKYWLNSSGDGKLKKLIVTDGLQLGNIGTYSLGGGGNGKLGHLTVMGTLDVSAATTVRGDLSVMGVLGVDDLTVNEDLSVMGTLYFGDGSGMYRYNVTNEGDGCLNSISVMQGLYFGGSTDYYLQRNGTGRLSVLGLHRLSVMEGLYFGEDGLSGYYLESDGDGRLRDLGVNDLSVMGALRFGGNSDYYLQSDGDGRLGEITVMRALYFGFSYKYVLDSDGYGCLNELSVMSALAITDGVIALGSTDSQYVLHSNGDAVLHSLSVMNALQIGPDDDYYLDGSNGTGRLNILGLNRLSVMEGLYFGESSAYGIDKNGDGTLHDLYINKISLMGDLRFGVSSRLGGEGWSNIVERDIAPYLPAAAAAEAEQPSFTKLTFPPTGTATEEQDPSWITKSHILMETNGGQLNLTQLTATLAYAAQTPLAIANKTLWLSTSSGTGDAVQWPANAVFPDDQSQDKIQQLNSNSTYWFDITYVGGSDTVLIRKVCSWAATTGENGPTE